MSGKTFGDLFRHIGEPINHLLIAAMQRTTEYGYEGVIYEFYSRDDEFCAVEARLAAVSRHANRVVCYIRAHFEWKSGVLKPNGFSMLPRFRKHFRAMPEPPEMIEALTWDLLNTKYWRAYFFLHDRTLPTREEFSAHYFHALPYPKAKKALEEKKEPTVRMARQRQAREIRESRKLASRFAIMHRDKFRCRLCGVAVSDGEHVRLEVDHIIPRSKGGSNEIENRWTLCFECNRGKGAKIL